MTQSKADGSVSTSTVEVIKQLLGSVAGELSVLFSTLRPGEVTPRLFAEVELGLESLIRELGRRILETVINEMEAASRRRVVIHQGLIFKQRKRKTRYQNVATLFGTITLRRFGYRYVDSRHVAESCIFPLELRLGLIEHVTPVLGARLAKQMASVPQRAALDWLRETCDVRMGVERLRNFCRHWSQFAASHRQEVQVDLLLAAIRRAGRQKGKQKPVLAVGRDGITICENNYSFYEVATAATIAVFDRKGKRITTVYLAYSAEHGQATMSQMLTNLLTEVFTRWTGALPTLAYVADSGGNESTYFGDVLRKMKHPRTGERLAWQRVVDYYHTAERIWTIAEALFGKKHKLYKAWVRRMLRILKYKENGPKRVLQSVAYHSSSRKLGKARKETLRRAVNYIRRRTKWMQFASFRERNIPIGSGITEAACKTIFTQRLKQSGMRWSSEGAGHILNLRVILLSNAWEPTFNRILDELESQLPRPYERNSETTYRNAA